MATVITYRQWRLVNLPGGVPRRLSIAILSKQFFPVVVSRAGCEPSSIASLIRLTESNRLCSVATSVVLYQQKCLRHGQGYLLGHHGELRRDFHRGKLRNCADRKSLVLSCLTHASRYHKSLRPEPPLSKISGDSSIALPVFHEVASSGFELGDTPIRRILLPETGSTNVSASYRNDVESSLPWGYYVAVL